MHCCSRPLLRDWRWSQAIHQGDPCTQSLQVLQYLHRPVFKLRHPGLTTFHQPQQRPVKQHQQWQATSSQLAYGLTPFHPPQHRQVKQFQQCQATSSQLRRNIGSSGQKRIQHGNRGVPGDSQLHRHPVALAVPVVACDLRSLSYPRFAPRNAVSCLAMTDLNGKMKTSMAGSAIVANMNGQSLASSGSKVAGPKSAAKSGGENARESSEKSLRSSSLFSFFSTQLGVDRRSREVVLSFI